MGLGDTPSGERVHVGFFGVRNAGKSSLVNAVTGQDVSVVSDVAGTTTDSVRKAMELPPIGPVLIIDTPGIDDVGELGELRVKRAMRDLTRCDVAVLVVDRTRGAGASELALLDAFEKSNVPHIVAYSKADLLLDSGACDVANGSTVSTSAASGRGIEELKELIGSVAMKSKERGTLVSDIIAPGDAVVLVVPVDDSAPKGRLILPQQLVMRDVLDAHGKILVCQPDELGDFLAAQKIAPKIVITDSQVFKMVAQVVPNNVLLTSFSILMARYRGTLQASVRNVRMISCLRDGDSVLIAEGCTHHRQCDDIGAVKMPSWIEAHCGAKLRFEFSSGRGFPDDLSSYGMIVHCGGCMLNDREMGYRLQRAEKDGVPIVNYGMAIAEMTGILERSLLFLTSKGL